VPELILPEPAAASGADPHQAAAAPARAPWGFWATCVWGIGAFAAMVVAEVCATVGLVEWWRAAGKTVPNDLAAQPVALATATFAVMAACVAVLWLAARVARVSVADYLALRRVDAATLLIGLGCTLSYLAAADILAYASGRGLRIPLVQGIYWTALESGTLPLLLLPILLALPVTEELLFRGFLLRGWAASRLGAVGAVALTAAIWAGLHVQYAWIIIGRNDWIAIGQLFGLGLLFGYLRLRSGSTLTTILLHAAYSAGTLIQAAILAG
jgi:membrane protease YdiL (CAAX protease family)